MQKSFFLFRLSFWVKLFLFFLMHFFGTQECWAAPGLLRRSTSAPVLPVASKTKPRNLAQEVAQQRALMERELGQSVRVHTPGGVSTTSIAGDIFVSPQAGKAPGFLEKVSRGAIEEIGASPALTRDVSRTVRGALEHEGMQKQVAGWLGKGSEKPMWKAIGTTTEGVVGSRLGRAAIEKGTEAAFQTKAGREELTTWAVKPTIGWAEGAANRGFQALDLAHGGSFSRAGRAVSESEFGRRVSPHTTAAAHAAAEDLGRAAGRFGTRTAGAVTGATQLWHEAKTGREKAEALAGGVLYAGQGVIQAAPHVAEAMSKAAPHLKRAATEAVGVARPYAQAGVELSKEVGRYAVERAGEGMRYAQAVGETLKEHGPGIARQLPAAAGVVAQTAGNVALELGKLGAGATLEMGKAVARAAPGVAVQTAKVTGQAAVAAAPYATAAAKAGAGAVWGAAKWGAGAVGSGARWLRGGKTSGQEKPATVASQPTEQEQQAARVIQRAWKRSRLNE